MTIKYRLIPVLLFGILPITVKAQSRISIPAYTAYAVPAEGYTEAGESNMFSRNSGLINWTDNKQQVQFFFKIRNSGKLNLWLNTKIDAGGNSLSATIAGKTFKVNVPVSKVFKPVLIGTVLIRDTGFYTLTLSALHADGNTIADIRSLEMDGDAARGVHFNPKERRNAASVHLLYPLPDSMNVVSFYNEITVPEGADPLYSYYMACGFSRGYFGIQVNSPSERRVIFSVWDAGNEAVDRDKVTGENRVQLIAKGENVFADGFGNEGTGGHSHWVYPWKTGQAYKFLVTAVTDSAKNSTSYTGYFFIPETQQWKLIACFSAPKDGKPLRKLYSFVEDFEGNNGQMYRKAFFGNQWIRRENGEWKELTESSFSFDATGKAGDRIDYGGGVDSNRFYLWNGGYRSSNAHFGDRYIRKANIVKPAIDLYRNADSATEAVIENRQMLEAIQTGRMDTTGSAKGLYYKILQEGNGEPVNAGDTMVVRYKGSLLNGFVFDETKDKPAVFPLNRLIKGMQIGMPFCRQGGKIRLMMPSSLAYSTRNLGIIPPNSVLMFDVEVLEINKLKLR